MLKTVSSITNAIGALNYKGTWDASTNTPALASGVGTKGDYYVVSVAGTTTLDGISNWYVGDWAAFNGSVWQRLEGGVDDPALSLKSNSTTGLMQITGPAAGQTRVITVPDANATMARTDAAQTFTGSQTFSDTTNFFATTAAPSNPVSGNKYMPLGDIVIENINNKTVGASAVQLTKNGSYGGMAFITAIQAGAGSPYNAIVIWTANQAAVVVSSGGGFAGGATAVFGVGGPYNGALMMNLSNVIWGNATVSGIAFTTNRY